MSPFQLRPYQPADEAEVIALWHACDLVRPWNDPQQDIARKLQVNPEWFLVAERERRIVGSIMTGYEGHRGWINYLAVQPDERRRGLGRALMDEAERLLRAAGCPKINLLVRQTNSEVIAFYARLGFTEDAAISLGKRLVHD